MAGTGVGEEEVDGRVAAQGHQSLGLVGGGLDLVTQVLEHLDGERHNARVILAAANRVEAAHPSLIGGVGVYPGTSAHGPFTHIDTRGYPARWIGTGD